MRIFRTFLKTIPVLLASLAMAPAMAADPAPTPSFELAVMEAEPGDTLDDILSGRAQPGFTPVLTPGFAFHAVEGKVLWVRVRADLPPPPPGGWRVSIVRVPLDHIRVRVQPPGEVVARTSFFGAQANRSPWPAKFELALPPELTGKTSLYLELEGNVRGGLHVRLQDAVTVQQQEHAARRLFRLVYGLLLLVAVLSVVRHVEDARSGALAVGGAALGVWLALLGFNGHIYALPEIALLSNLGAAVPQALLLLAAGPMVLATRHYSGLAKSAPGLSPLMRGLGWLLVAIALVGLVSPRLDASALQLAAWIGNGLAGMACLLMLAMDSRSYRWAPLLTLVATGGFVMMRVLADQQIVAPTAYHLYGWQVLLAVTITLYLGLPWGRARLQRWSMRKRAAPPEPSAEEKIKVAREKLIQSLQAGLKNAADGDLKWIAFRRLLDGLKTVLPQSSAAVVAMHFHGEDLLQVEPPDAEARYRELLAQRSTLLKNLSRLRAPQQIGIDFDGPTGPLDQVQLAIIPLPIAKPGWGALLVERRADVTYSDAELSLCAEFAAVAIIAGEEAAGVVNAQRNADTDAPTGVYRREAMMPLLLQQIDHARQKQLPLSLLYVVLDQLPKLRESGGEVAAIAGLRPVADLLREEIDYGDLMGRSGPEGFLLVAPGKGLLKARDYAERLRAAVSHLVVDPRIAAALTISVGVAQSGRDERDPAALAERAAKSAQIAVKNGGNQIFS